jgi:phosphatidylglycerol---prolipoprotein diacylglyceryl transferase
MSTLAYASGFPFSNPVVRFYALFILAGACLAFLLSNYRARKAGYGHNFFDTVFIIAFPMGIVGARIWYVIASWSAEFLPVYQNQGFWAGFGNMFAVWNGGLAIQGGVILGVISGVLVVRFRRKGVSILQAMDFAVPTIFVAQMFGRWGNFFNQEVFGHAVSPDAWNFLPSFITNNMQNGDSSMLSGVKLPNGSIAAPLFLVEGVVNILFYFILTQGIPAIERRKYVNGDQAFGYFIAYGIIRAILEPLRNPSFIMGTSDVTSSHSNYKSFGMAIAFVIVGVVLIIANHILYHLSEKGKFDKVPFIKGLYLQELSSMEVKKDSLKDGKSEDTDSLDLEKLKQIEKQNHIE